ncbi:hypothetical protein EBU58_08780 [bacterium]|nr:hypothetical protein [bacterium]
MWVQHQIQLAARSRGFHLITREVVESIPELADLRVGLVLGTWQGIYLSEHRDRGGRRRLLATLHGE